MGTIQKVDSWLLPKNLKAQYSPYVWLVYLPLFIVPVLIFSEKPLDWLLASLAVVAFLGLYFRSFWVARQQVIYYIIGIVILGTLAAFIAPTANTFFVYAGAFCSRLKPFKYAFCLLAGILIWLGLVSWLFSFDVYFYVPGLIFTFIVGLLNIYQYAWHQNKQALILSRKETQRLAKVAERERIARDLHDLIGHTFSVITLKADLAGRLLVKGQPNDLEKARLEIKQLEDISREALSQVHEVVSGYRTSDLLSELANGKKVLASLDIDFDYRFENLDEQSLALDAKSNKELAIILRELVTNIIKHARATRVRVCIKHVNNQVVMIIQDNGEGFEKSACQGFGIKGIEERIQKLQGFFNIKSGLGYTGTLSEIGLPMTVKDDAQ